MMKKIVAILVCMLMCVSILTIGEAKNEISTMEEIQTFQPTNGPNETVVAVYLFDEGSGDIVHDSSGNELHGSNVNGNWTEGAGYNGSALAFSKIENRYVIVRDNPAFDLKTFTISALIKPMKEPSAWPRGYLTIVSKEYQYILRFFSTYNGGKPGISAIYFINQSIFSHIAVTVYLDEINESFYPKIDEWNSIKMSYDGVNLKLFLNDNLLGEKFSPADEFSPHFSDKDLIIGNHQMYALTPPESSEDEFIGAIDFVEISGEPGGNMSDSNDDKTEIKGIVINNPLTGKKRGILRYNIQGTGNSGWKNLRRFPYRYELSQLETLKLGKISIINGIYDDRLC